jgi:hypothetical protein
MGSEGVVDSAAAANVALHSYCFGTSTITISRISEMVALNYFVDGDVRAPIEETIPEPGDNEVVVFEAFFTAPDASAPCYC